MRIVMTGASGYLGTSLRRALRGDDVVPVARPLSARGLPERCDAVIHLAQPRRDEADADRDTFAVNVDATDELIRYARSSGAQAFLFASSGSVYAPGTVPHDETDPLDITALDPYVRSKIAGEEVVGSWCREVRCLVFRLFTPYGPGQRRRMIPDLIERVRAGRPVVLTNGGRPSVSPVHVADLTAWVSASLSHPDLSGVFNIAGDDIVDVRWLAVTIGRLGGWDVRLSEANAEVSADLVGKNDRIVAATGLRPLYRLEVGLQQLVEEIARGS